MVAWLLDHSAETQWPNSLFKIRTLRAITGTQQDDNETKEGNLSVPKVEICWLCTGLLKKMEGIWNRYNLKSTGRIYTFGVLKCSEKFKVLDLP